MRHCPKCDLRYDDSSKICRSCGAILDEVPEPEVESPQATVDATPLPTPPSDVPWRSDAVDFERSRGKVDDWTCPTCGESLPGSFELCWKCESENTVEVDEETAADVVDAAFEDVKAQMRCLACGSTRVIPDAHVADQGQYSSGALRVVVYGDPDALFFKESLYGPCTANVCGDCGHVQLQASNYHALYQHYLRREK